MKYKLQDLIDLEHFQNLQDRLNLIYSFPSSIIDNDGNILTATAWQDVCTKFHRKNKEAERLCIKSDQYILEHLHEANPAVSYRCPHGLVDNATPIVIDGVHYGNFFTGQFFLEEPDLAVFRAQAKRYGFEEDAYIEAVKRVPIWTQKQLENYLFFIKGLIAVIAESGLKNLREIENRKKIEKSEKRYRSILRAALDGYWLTDIHGRLLEVNEAYCRMSGYSEKELLTMHIADLEINETPELIAEHMKQVVVNGSDRFDTRHRRKDGTVFDVEVSIQFRTEKDGRCVCFLRDISRQKLYEAAITDSEEKFRGIFHYSNIGIALADPDGNLIEVNPEFVRILGYSRVELLQMNFADFTHPDDLYQEIEKTTRLKNREIDDYRITKRYITRNGESRWVEVAVTSRRNTGGEVDMFIGMVMDITDRAKAEVELKTSRERLRLALDSVSDAVWDWRVDTGEVYFSSRWYTMLGYEPYELPQTFETWRDLLHPDDLPRAQAKVFRHLESSEPFEIEFRMRTRDNNWRWIFARGKSIEQDDQGKAVRMLGTHVDITERKKLEEQVQQAQKMESVGRLAGGVAHDFNNMLTLILGHLEFALEKAEGDLDLTGDLKEIQKAAKRSTDLTKQLLTFARKQIISPKTLDLNTVVESMLSMLRRLIGENISLKWKPAGRLWPVRMDPSQIDQILANLCVNARDAISGVGKLTIETGMRTFDPGYCENNAGCIPGDFVMLAVSDDGCGMDKQTRNNLFEPFFTTKKIGEGTGLGLATIYGIVKQNKGFITVYSELGQGTTFKIYLPRSYPHDEPPQAIPPEKPVPTGNETILVVEDEASILRMTRMMLESKGYSVLTAAAPAEAIATAKAHDGKIHLLMTDVVMPEMNGRDLAEHLAGICPGIKRLFMSGYTADVIAHQGVLDEGIAFIQKPFSIKELGEKLREVLDHTTIKIQPDLSGK